MNKMEITKVHWTSEGDNVTLTMPLTKINQEKRLVSGWATLDSTDQQGDVLTAEASSRAFRRFRGNIREMHQPIAVGRLVDFREDEYFDEKTGESYRGVYVTAHVSKGAQDTWEKVLDGTLTGFSVGGKIIEDSKEFVRDASGAGKTVRFIKDYSLDELSLVDNPCNQHANLVSIEKMADGSTVITGDAVDTRAENIFYCPTDGISLTSEDESRTCYKCDTNMKVIGWLESNEPNKAEAVTKAIASSQFASNNNSGIITYSDTATTGSPATITINVTGTTNPEEIAKALEASLRKTNGGVNVADNDKKAADAPKTEEETQAELVEAGADEETEAGTGVEEDAVVEPGDVAPEADSPARDDADNKASAENVEAQADADAEKPADEETEAGTGTVEEDPAVQKMVAALEDVISKGLTANAEKATEAITSVQASVDDIAKSLESKISALTEKYDALSKSVEEIGGEVETVEKRVDSVEDDTAIKKSGDVEPSEENIKKSVWGGRFLGFSDLNA